MYQSRYAHRRARIGTRSVAGVSRLEKQPTDLASAHERQHKRLQPAAHRPLLAGRNQSGRDLTKVEAQYEVLGNEAKNRSVPLGTIASSAFDFARGSAIASIRRSSRPGRVAL